MIRTWKLTITATAEMTFADMTSLDAITRQLPEGYYSTFRTFDRCTRVLGFADHLRRLYDPVPTPEVSVSTLRRQLLALLEHYRPDEGRVRLIMTKQGQIYIAIEPLKLLSRDVYKRGVRVETAEMHRESPLLKSTAFIGISTEERKHIAQEGVFEALLVKDGEILEGMTSNFFYVQYARAEQNEPKANVDEARAHLPRAQVPGASALRSAQREAVLYTAQDGVLLGITRQIIIEIAQNNRLEVKYQPLKRDQLAAAQEAFITSSSRGIVPVIQIDDVTIGQGIPGPITKKLSAIYDVYVTKKAEKIES
ncbi:MAG TPA: aminotransferase class IV [Anaerolineales bacterium]|nr:aminotransferase class IV [Anaerolineales bacterium]